MFRVAVLGESVAISGYGLAGALVVQAESEADVRAAWSDLPEDVVVVVLTARAARALGDTIRRTDRPFTVVMPQ